MQEAFQNPQVNASSNEVEPYNRNEINGKFKITSEHWTEELDNPESEHYHLMSETITRGIMELIEDKGLTHQADFHVDIVSFK